MTKNQKESVSWAAWERTNTRDVLCHGSEVCTVASPSRARQLMTHRWVKKRVGLWKHTKRGWLSSGDWTWIRNNGFSLWIKLKQFLLAPWWCWTTISGPQPKLLIPWTWTKECLPFNNLKEQKIYLPRKRESCRGFHCSSFPVCLSGFGSWLYRPILLASFPPLPITL